MREIIVAEDLDKLSRLAADRFVSLAKEAIESSRSFTVALAGGSTPRSLYRLLASEKYKTRVDWPKVFFFFGDERPVPPDHPDSNFRMAKENLFDLLDIPPLNIFRWKTEEGPEQAAVEYETAIGSFFGAGPIPCFDMVLLGMGADGHTASLFPYSPALKERSRIAVANRVDKLDSDRLTMTFPVINNAGNIFFLVSGAEKAAALKEILEGDPDPDKYPSQLVSPEKGDLIWFVDKKAASQLTTRDRLRTIEG